MKFSPIYLAFKSFLNNFLDFKNNSKKMKLLFESRAAHGFWPTCRSPPSRFIRPSWPSRPAQGSSPTLRQSRHRAPLCTAASSSCHGCHALPCAPCLYGRPLPHLNLSYNRNLKPLFPPPFNSCHRPLLSSPPRCSFPQPYKYASSPP
jgi:hypothetical protein